MPAGAAGRAFVGLALLGWGLSILLGVSPHEDLLAGAGLAVFGLALVATAPALPAVGRMPPAVVAGVGAALAAGILLFTLVSGSPLDLPKVSLLAFGTALALAAPFLDREVRLPGRRVPVASLVACALPVLGAPLAVWGVQALFEGAVGTTPVEALVRFGLLAPLAAFLGALGLHPSVHGQTVTYATPRGPLSVEVGAACSGVQAMALFAGVLALYLVAERPGGRRLALWSCIGLLGVYVANLLRLAALALVGYQWGPEALVRAHAEAGWVFFVAWAVAFARLARSPARPPRGQPAD